MNGYRGQSSRGHKHYRCRKWKDSKSYSESSDSRSYSESSDSRSYSKSSRSNSYSESYSR